jgi:hypothetical protein
VAVDKRLAKGQDNVEGRSTPWLIRVGQDLAKNDQERNLCEPRRFSSFKHRIIIGLSPEEIAS